MILRVKMWLKSDLWSDDNITQYKMSLWIKFWMIYFCHYEFTLVRKQAKKSKSMLCFIFSIKYSNLYQFVHQIWSFWTRLSILVKIGCKVHSLSRHQKEFKIVLRFQEFLIPNGDFTNYRPKAGLWNAWVWF